MTEVLPRCPRCGTEQAALSFVCRTCGHSFASPDVETGIAFGASSAALPEGGTLVGEPNGGTLGPLRVGAALGSRYHIIRILGAGGMGIVYQAWDAELNVAVAVKVIRPEILAERGNASEVERRFKHELLLARQITHPNVVRIHDFGELNGIKYLTMPFIEGENLSAALHRRGKFLIPEALSIARQIVAGLAAAHHAGIVHRDLKPENIMLSADGTALIMDFGISRSMSSAVNATASGTVVGTLEYMAPEQAKGQPADPRADIYAFGLILYDMLAGRQRMARSDNGMTEMMSRMQRPPTSLRLLDHAIPEALERVVSRCVEPAIEKRFQTTPAVIAALDAITPGGHALSVRRSAWRSPFTLVSLAVAVIALAIAGWSTSRARLPAAPVDPLKPVSVLIANFDNRAGEEQFEGLLEQAMAVGIEGTSFITAFPRREALRVAREIAPDKLLTEDVARLVSTREGIDRIVAGVISSADGTTYQLRLKVLNPAEAKPILEWHTDIASKNEVLGAVAMGASRIRTALGDSTASAAGQETFTARTLAAAQTYAKAQELLWAGDTDTAAAEYEKAISLDPEFGRAYAGLAVLHFNAGRRDKAIEFYKAALQHTDRMTERERLRTRGGYYLLIRNTAKANEELQSLVDKYPADTAALANLAVNRVYERKMAEAVSLGHRAALIYPKNIMRRLNVALFMMYAGDFDGAERDARATLALKPDYAKAYVAISMAQLGRDQPSEAETTWRTLETIPGGRSLAIAGLADLALFQGKLAKATAILQEEGAMPADARRLVMLGETQLAQGKESAAATTALAASQKSKEDPAVVFLAGRILAETGRPQALALADAMRRDIDVDPKMYGSLLAGEVSLKQRDPQRALEHFTEAQRLNDTWLGRYALGRALLAAKRYPEAESEFDKCLIRRGEVTAVFLDEIPTYRLLPAVHFYMGLVREGLKNERGARESFRKFVDIKKDGDEDGMVVAARNRLAAR